MSTFGTWGRGVTRSCRAYDAVNDCEAAQHQPRRRRTCALAARSSASDAGSGTGTISTPRNAVANPPIVGDVASVVRLAEKPDAVPSSISLNNRFEFAPVPSKLVAKRMALPVVGSI